MEILFAEGLKDLGWHFIGWKNLTMIYWNMCTTEITLALFALKYVNIQHVLSHTVVSTQICRTFKSAQCFNTFGIFPQSQSKSPPLIFFLWNQWSACPEGETDWHNDNNLIDKLESGAVHELRIAKRGGRRFP